MMPRRPGLEQRQDFPDRCLPLALHGDGVSVANVKEQRPLTWSNLLGTGPTKVASYLIWFCHTCGQEDRRGNDLGAFLGKTMPQPPIFMDWSLARTDHKG